MFTALNYNDFKQLLEEISKDIFRETEIQIKIIPNKVTNKHKINMLDQTICNYLPSNENDLGQEDLINFAAIFNANPWCVNNVISIWMPNNFLKYAPQFIATKLKQLDLQSNSIVELPQLSKTPNLRALTLTSMNLTRIEALRACPHLIQFYATNNNLRVPPNPIGCNNLRFFFVIENNPLTLLGKYALLIIEAYHNKLMLDDFNYGNLKIEFARNLGKELNEDDLKVFFSEFSIPPAFFTEQVNAVISYMHNTYYYPYNILPAEKEKSPSIQKHHPHQKIDDFLNGEFNVSPMIMPESALRMREDYQIAKRQIFTLIDLIVQKLAQGNNSYDIDQGIITQKITPFIIDLSAHQKYFLDELLYDFNTLRQIFFDTEKAVHVSAIDNYVDKNKETWPRQLDIQEKFSNDAGLYFSYVAQKLGVVKQDFSVAEAPIKETYRAEPPGNYQM